MVYKLHLGVNKDFAYPKAVEEQNISLFLATETLSKKEPPGCLLEPKEIRICTALELFLTLLFQTDASDCQLAQYVYLQRHQLLYV